jgi:hypothetical protein
LRWTTERCAGSPGVPRLGGCVNCQSLARDQSLRRQEVSLVLGHCYGKCRTRMQSWKLADEATDDRRQGGSPLSTYFSPCRQRQEGSLPRTRTLLRKVSYSDAPRTQSRKLAAEAATEINTKFSDTRDSASGMRSRRPREAERLKGQIMGDGGECPKSWVNSDT